MRKRACEEEEEEEEHTREKNKPKTHAWNADAPVINPRAHLSSTMNMMLFRYIRHLSSKLIYECG